MSVAVNAFNLTEIAWYPDRPRWEGRWAVLDANWDSVRVPGADHGDLMEASTFEGLWRSATQGLTLPSTVREPDFAKVHDLTRKALSIGCLWGAHCWNGEWDVACIDEVRGKGLEGFTADTLDEALGQAVASALSLKEWLEEAREDWSEPEAWLARAMDLARNSPEALGPELIVPAAGIRP